MATQKSSKDRKLERELTAGIKKRLKDKDSSVEVEASPGFAEHLASAVTEPTSASERRRVSMQKLLDKEGLGPDSFVREDSKTTHFKVFAHGGFAVRIKDDPDAVGALDAQFSAIKVAAQRELAQLVWVFNKMKVHKVGSMTRSVFDTAPRALTVLARAVFEGTTKGVEVTPMEVEHIRLVTAKFFLTMPAKALDKKLLHWASLRRRRGAVGDSEFHGDLHTLVTDRLRHHKGEEFTGEEFDVHRDKVKAFLMLKVQALRHDPGQTTFGS